MSEHAGAQEALEGPGNSRSDEWFRLDEAPKLSVRALGRSRLGLTEIRYDGRNFGMSEPVEPEDAFLVSLTLRAYPQIDIWYGSKTRSPASAVGQHMLFDLKTVSRARFTHPIHLLHFYLPRSFLDELSDDLEAPRIDQLRVTPGQVDDDPILFRLGNAMRPALDAPEQANELYVSEAMLAFGTYVCGTNGVLQTPRYVRGGLSALQERIAKAMIDAHLDGGITLQDLAAACGLSAPHLAHAFKASVGVSPHRWLLLRRVERAKALLRLNRGTLADIASDCGFADQSHLTRVFRRATGLAPGAWRQQLH